MGNKQPKQSAKQPVAARPNNAIESIGKMENTQKLLTKRRDLLEKRCDNFVKTAKAKMAAGDKKGALFALKQKKMYSKQVTNLENQLLALEQQKVALEGASISATVVNTMSTGAKAMSDIHKGMDVDAVNDLKDEIDEHMEMTNEINEAIAGPLIDMDEDELMGELDDMIAEDTEDLLPEMTGVPSLPAPSLNLPDVPTQKPVVAKQTSEDAELNELDLLMA